MERTGKFPKTLYKVTQKYTSDHSGSCICMAARLLHADLVMSSLEFPMAEDIYTAAGWKSTYQNGYLHGSPSRFSDKSAIYTAAGCQH